MENDFLSRSYALSTNFTGKKLSLSTGYTAVNIDSTTDIVFCTGSPCTPGTGTEVSAVSLWSFADNHYFGDAAYRFGDRVRVSLKGQMTDSRDTFPVDYYYVEPRVSVRFFSGYWLNLAWYRYEFDRERDNLQDYRAEGGLFSVSATF